jgi:hypothetical protein
VEILGPLKELYLSIFGPIRWPGPSPAHTSPAHGPYCTAWAEILKLANFFGPSPARNAVFSYFTI